MRALALSAVAFLSTTACAGIHGSGVVVRSQPAALPAFTEVQLGGDLDVVIRRGEPSVALEGGDNVIAAYDVGVEGEALHVRPKPGTSVSSSRTVKVAISLPVLRAVTASGGVDLLVESGVDQSLSVSLSGGVEVKAGGLALAVLQVDASGGVKLELDGSAETADFKLSGGVTVHADRLASKTVLLDASGGCDVDVAASEAISGQASGGVDITVQGNPPKSRLETSGGASVRWAD